MFSSSGSLSVSVLACGMMLDTSPTTVTSLLMYLGVCEVMILGVGLAGNADMVDWVQLIVHHSLD